MRELIKTKKKIGRPPKKKVIDSFVETGIVPPVVDEAPKCECGKPMHPNHHPHCWDCSHRA